MSRMWVALQLSRLEPLTRMAKHVSRVWVACSPVFEQIRTTNENVWPHIQVVSCSPVLMRTTNEKGKTSRMWVALQWLSRLEPLTRKTYIQRVSYSSVFELTKSTDKNCWTHIQQVSYSPVFELMRTADENGWTYIQEVSHSPIKQIRITDKKCVQDVSHSLEFEQIRTTDENNWTHV